MTDTEGPVLAALLGYVRRHHSVGTKQLKPNAVTSAKVRNGALRAADFAPGTRLTGPAGPRGLPGSDAQFNGAAAGAI